MTSGIPGSQYKDVVLFLATAGVVVPIFRRWRISPILGFLGAGVALGPFGLGALAPWSPWLRYLTVDRPDEIAQLAEFGVVFLLFTIGLELSWERLRTLRRLVFGLGGLQVAVCASAIAGVALLLKLSPVAAATVGTALSLSSTAIVMPLLGEQKRQYSQTGRAAFSILLLQDLAVAPILVTIAILGGEHSEVFSPRQLLAFAPAMLGLLGLIVLGRLVLRPMMKSVARAKSQELFVAACLLVVIGAGLIAAVSGLSMALGAFIAGLLLAETEFRHEVEATVEPFKGLLLGLFFVSVGISLNLSLVVAEPAVIVGSTLALMLLNGTIIFVLGRLFRLKAVVALETALLLAASGEFAFVILNSAMGADILARDVGQTLLVSSTLSMFCIPLLASVGAEIRRRLSMRAGEALPQPELNGETPRVLVVGYGRVGKLVADMLTRHKIPWLAIERETAVVEAAVREGRAVFFGDASRPDLLRRVGLDSALAVVVTMDSPEGAEAVVTTAREARPNLTVVVRARDARQAKRLYTLGATDAVPETIEASLQLSEALLVEIGVPMGLVIASIHERRDEFRRELNDPDALGGRARRALKAQPR
ncbi:MAG TPA: cation:proton antiporter [Rhizomicrobium sp.]|nr:cation:proton antiporter [Rhizomicrobium sp.]